MIDKFKNKYSTKSSRVQGYDYSQNGAYFITICTKDKKHFFGKIKDNEMFFTEIGKIVDITLRKIPQQFKFVQLDEYIIMPNHIHVIIMINQDSRDAIYRVSASSGGITGSHNPMTGNSLSKIIRWYKGRCTFEINKLYKNAINRVSTDIDFAWQSRFYDRIIRNDIELNKIREYIQINPREWDNDKNNIGNCVEL